MNGATIQGKDKYGLVDPTTTINARVKIELNIFQKEKVFLFARVRSVIEADLKQDFTYLIGVEFEELEEWQEGRKVYLLHVSCGDYGGYTSCSKNNG